MNEDKKKLIRDLLIYTKSYIAKYDYEITEIVQEERYLSARIKFNTHEYDVVRFNFIDIFTYLNSK